MSGMVHKVVGPRFGGPLKGQTTFPAETLAI